jgi:hypothetical protein
MFKCEEHNKEFNCYDSLRKHYSRVHKVNSVDFYIKYNLNGIQSLCKCGCGQITTWNGHGFRDYRKGHIARIVNNWGHNLDAINKSSETRRQQFKNNERLVWNKGLNKETDIRIKKYGQTISNNFTDEQRKNYSERMKKEWVVGKLYAISGINSHNWKGGISHISCIIRSNSRYYREWIYPILVRDKFTCQHCGFQGKLEAHHTEQQYSDIVKLFIERKKEYTYEEKLIIAEQVIDYHIKNNVQGITLCKFCHKKEHASYNF